jgi:threonine aldolase
MTTTYAPLDYRSDTVTRPTEAMRRAMAAAPVGDDVLEEDPTVQRLEAVAAERFGHEAALFVPTGTMANLIAVALHCQRGDELICERRTHTFAYEGTGAAALLGVSFNVTDTADGILTPEWVHKLTRPDDIHCPVTKLLVVENTANTAGGRIVSLERMAALAGAARAHRLNLHIDGARIFNASVAAGVPVADWAKLADTVSFCLSKGLGAPVGSVIVGPREAMKRARRWRKMFGGGMRQVGIVAAAGLYALENNVARLADDHALATSLAAALGETLDGRFSVQAPETNILLVHTDSKETTGRAVAAWQARGILCLALKDTMIRFVTHMDLPVDAVTQTVERIKTAGV